MEKYTSEVLAQMSHEELENAVIELMGKVESTQKNVDMYKGFWDSEVERNNKAASKIDAIQALLKSWG